MKVLYAGQGDDVHPEVKHLATTLPRRCRILDLGCGPGRHALFLAAQDHDVTAVDKDAEAVKKCRALGLLYGRSIRDVVGDIRDPSLLDGSLYDVVICTFVLQDLLPGDTAAAMRTVRRLTAPQGMAMVTTYVGNGVQRNFVRSIRLLGEREVARNFTQAGWDLRVDKADPGAHTFENGKEGRWPYSCVIARRPAAPDQLTSSIERMARLKRDDPEAYEDAVLYGLGPFAEGAVG